MIRRLFKYLIKVYCSKNISKYEEPLYIGSFSSFNKNTYLGKNVSFNGFHVFGKGELHIGDNFHSGKGCSAYTSIHNYDEGSSIPYDNSFIKRNIIIGDNVWLGGNVTLIGSIEIYLLLDISMIGIIWWRAVIIQILSKEFFFIF